MSELKAGNEPYHVTLTTAEGIEIGLLSINDEGKPVEFEGSLTPVDSTAQFRPGGIPREWNDFSAGGGYSFYDPRIPNGYAWAKNVWTLVPNAALPSGALTEVPIDDPADGGQVAVIYAGIEASGHLYLGGGKYFLKVVDGNASTATQLTSFASTIGIDNVHVTSACVYLGNIYWSGYQPNTMTGCPLVQHAIASDTFTAGATCVRWHVASFSGVDGEGTWGQWMVGTVASNAAFKYTNSASPLTDTNWTPGSADGIAVGDSSRMVNRIVTSRQAPFFLKPEGVHIVQRFGVQIPNITPHWDDTYHSENGVAGTIVGGKLYAGILTGLDMVIGLDGQLNDTPYLVTPGMDLPNETPVAGDVKALCRDGDWIVAAMYNDNNQTSYICWGKPRSSIPGQPGLTPMVWHMSPCVIEGERVTFMKKSAPNGEPRLWIATARISDGTIHLYWMSLPKNGNVLQELGTNGPWRTRTDVCTLYLPSDSGGQGVHAEKSLRNVATTSQGASDQSYLQPYAAADNDERTELGARVTESAYVESRVTSDIHGRQIAASIDMVAGSDTTPPILRALTIWSGEGIRSSSVYRGRFRFAKGMKLRTGGDDAWDDPEAVWNLLRGVQGPRPATLIDWKGRTYTVAFEQGASWKERESGDKTQWEIDVVLQFTVLSTEAAYNDGYRYDANADYVE